MTPHEEAIELFYQVIHALMSGTGDLKTQFRRCQHACQLVGWPGRSWFQQELAGYTQGAEIPWYRIVKGRLIWRPKVLAIEKALEDVLSGTLPELIEEVSLDVYAGIDWLVAASQSGYQEVTDET